MQRTSFKEFKWTDESIEAWEPIWAHLWRLKIQWVWQQGDHYARRLRNPESRSWTIFTAVERNWLHGDLDDVAPLPSITVIKELLKWVDHRIYSVEENSTQEELVKHTISLMESWLDTYGAVNGTAPLL